jgi:hypothetical protein
MQTAKSIKVIEKGRQPPLWSVKVGARYEGSFSGQSARANAIIFAATLARDFAIVEGRFDAERLKIVYPVDSSSAVWSDIDLCTGEAIAIRYDEDADKTTATFD